MDGARSGVAIHETSLKEFVWLFFDFRRMKL
jgi:hypothetical protein